MPTFFGYKSNGASTVNYTTYGTTAGLNTSIAFDQNQEFDGVRWYPSPDQTLGYVFAKSVANQNFSDKMHTWTWRNGAGAIPNPGAMTSSNGNVIGPGVDFYNVSAVQAQDLKRVNVLSDYAPTSTLIVGAYLATGGTIAPSYHNYDVINVVDNGTYFTIQVASNVGDSSGPATNGDLIFFGGAGTVEFWRSAGLTNQAFVDSVNYLLGTNYTSAQTTAAKAAIFAAGYWTTF